jgi:O-antigen/teichoic acid export membrane protein
VDCDAPGTSESGLRGNEIIGGFERVSLFVCDMFEKVKTSLIALFEKCEKFSGLDVSYFVRNGFWVFVRQLSLVLGGLLIYMAFARYASQESFGMYQLVLTIISVVSILSLPGMSPALVQAVVRKMDGTYIKVFRRSFWGSLVGLLFLLSLGALLVFLGNALGFLLLIVAPFFPFLSAFTLWDGFLQGRERFDTIARYSFLLSFFQVTSVCGALFFFQDDALFSVTFYLISTSVVHISLFLKSRLLVRNENVDEPSIQFGFFMTKMSGLGIVAEQIDKILIGFLLGPANLAIYTVVSFFGTRIKDIVRPFGSMLVPKMILEEADFLSLLSRHRKVLFFGSAVAIFCGGVFLFLVERVNLFIFSGNYSEFFELSKWYAVTVVLSIPLTVIGYYIYAKRNTYALAVSNTAFYIFRIALNVVSIVFYGLEGAVISYNISMAALLFVYAWGIYRQENNPTVSAL